MTSQPPNSNRTKSESQIILPDGTRRALSIFPPNIDIQGLNPADRVDVVKQLLRMRGDVLKNSYDGTWELRNSVTEQNAEAILKQYLSYGTLTAFESQNFGEVEYDHYPTQEEQLFGCDLNWPRILELQAQRRQLTFDCEKDKVASKHNTQSIALGSNVLGASNSSETPKIERKAQKTEHVVSKLGRELDSALKDFASSTTDDWKPGEPEKGNHPAQAATAFQKSEPTKKSTEISLGTQKSEIIGFLDDTIPFTPSHRPWNALEATKSSENPRGFCLQSKQDKEMIDAHNKSMKYYHRDNFNGRLTGQPNYKPKDPNETPIDILRRHYKINSADDKNLQAKKIHAPKAGTSQSDAPTGLFFLGSNVKINFNEPATNIRCSNSGKPAIDNNKTA